MDPSRSPSGPTLAEGRRDGKRGDGTGREETGRYRKYRTRCSVPTHTFTVPDRRDTQRLRVRGHGEKGGRPAREYDLPVGSGEGLGSGYTGRRGPGEGTFGPSEVGIRYHPCRTKEPEGPFQEKGLPLWTRDGPPTFDTGNIRGGPRHASQPGSRVVAAVVVVVVTVKRTDTRPDQRVSSLGDSRSDSTPEARLGTAPESCMVQTQSSLGVWSTGNCPWGLKTIHPPPL